MIVAVVGVGLIGGSIGLAARERLGATVRGFDPRADEAVARGAIHSAHRDLGDALDGAEAVFVAVPVDRLADSVRSVLAQAPRGCVVTDVGSTRSRRPAAWLGSTTTGRWLSSLSTGTAVRSNVKR